MNGPGRLVHKLRNTPVRELIRALKKDGFSLSRETRSGGRIYSHDDGRIVVVHYHRGSDTLPRKTLQSVLAGARWTEADAGRLDLL